MFNRQRFATATSNDKDPVAGAKQAARDVEAALEGTFPDLALVFVANHDHDLFEGVVEELVNSLRPWHLMGCTAECAIGDRIEHEGQPAVTLWAAVLPGAEIHSAHARLTRTPEGDTNLELPGMPEDAPGATLLLLGDPFSFPADVFLKKSAEERGKLQIIGGMASAARKPGENRLALASKTPPAGIFNEGAVAALLSGVRVEPLVSQGCKPFGRSMVITRAEENLLIELGGQQALAKLQEQLSGLSPSDQELLAQGLHLGIAMSAGKREHSRGDFLVRNVLGVHGERKAVVVADRLRLGQTVQFHLRDAASASEDLRLLLQGVYQQQGAPQGALLFSCNGRGSRLFGEPNHDATLVAEELGEIPVAGFSAAGELGPVGGQNFLHGFTASLALFYPESSGPFPHQ